MRYLLAILLLCTSAISYAQEPIQEPAQEVTAEAAAPELIPTPALANEKVRISTPIKKKYSPYDIYIGADLGYSYTVRNSLWDNTLTETTMTYRVPSLSAGFSYQVNKRLSLGLITGFEQFTNVETAIYDGKTVSKTVTRNLAIAPRLKWDWLRRDLVCLYSSFAFGYLHSIELEKLTNTRKTSRDTFSEFTFLGMRVGGDIYGYIDLSSSSMGFVRVGGGYKIKYKNK